LPRLSLLETIRRDPPRRRLIEIALTAKSKRQSNPGDK
jgi:hypothetical protein